MTHRERTGVRSLLYSGWHRTSSTARFVGRVSAAKLCMIDVDACEYCCYCGTPVALIETQESTQAPKQARVMTALARMADVPAYSVSVEAAPDGDVACFRVQRLAPELGEVAVMLPSVYAYWLLALRDQHDCTVALPGTESAA